MNARPLFLLCFSLAASMTATANAEQSCAGAKWRERLLAIASSKPFEMPYREKRVSQLLTDAQYSRGTLSYDPATATMTKQIDTPEQASFRVRGRTLTIVRHGKTRRVRLPKNSDLQWTLNAIAALANGKLPALATSHPLQCSSTGDNWAMLLTPLDADKKTPARKRMQELRSLQISGVGNKLLRLTTIMRNGDKTIVSRIPRKTSPSADAPGD